MGEDVKAWIDGNALRDELVAKGLPEEQADVAVRVLSGEAVVYNPGWSGGKRRTVEVMREIIAKYPRRTTTIEPDGTETHVWGRS